MPSSSSSILSLLATATTTLLIPPISAQGSTTTQTISLPSPSSTSHHPAPPDFLSIGFESAFLDNYANSPQNFTQNLISSLSSRPSSSSSSSSSPIILRVGGTSGDRLFVDQNLDSIKECRKGDCPNGSSATFAISPTRYFESFRKFHDDAAVPGGITWTFQAPMLLRRGKGDDLDIDIERTLGYVRRAWEALDSGKKVAGIALGNEPQVYFTEEGAEEYLEAGRKVRDAVVEELGLGSGGDEEVKKIFEWGETITGAVGGGGEGFDVQSLYEAGLGSVDDRVKFASEHYYQVPKADSGGEWDIDRLQAEMLNHTLILSTLSPYISTASALSTSHPETKYTISESGAILGPASLPLEFSSGFGSTLWSVDFLLAALSHGIQRVVDSGRPAARHASFVPDDSAASDGLPGPRVQAPWWANVFVRDFIAAPGDGEVDVAEVGLGEGEEEEGEGNKKNDGRLSAYAAWGKGGEEEGGEIKRLALVNMRAWNGSDYSSSGPEGERGEEVFAIPASGESVQVRRLHAALGVGAMGFDVGGEGSNITWAGEQWSFAVDQGKGHFVDDEGIREERHEVDGDKGEVTVRVKDSEAVIVYF